MSLREAQAVGALVAALQTGRGAPPAVAVILGSGWKEGAAELLEGTERLSLAGLPDWPRPRVEGHGSELAFGRLAGRPVVLCGGRVHAYEGYPARELVRGVRALAAWGVGRLLLLNAAGSLREERSPGSLMPFSDHMNLGLPNPMAADQSLDGKAQFLNLVDLYDPPWRAVFQRLTGQRFAEGVYAGLPGPCYETPAEVRQLRAMGADAVGMSTIPEAIAGKAAGMRVMAISFLSNYAAGIQGSRPSHGEVLETAAAHQRVAAQALEAAIHAAPN